MPKKGEALESLVLNAVTDLSQAQQDAFKILLDMQRDKK